MSEIKTLAGMSDAELKECISSACKRHIPNIDLPPKYHVIFDGRSMIYGEGMVKGYEFAESKFADELAATKQNLAGSEVALKLALTRAQCDRKDLEAAQLHIKELLGVLENTSCRTDGDGEECWCSDMRSGLFKVPHDSYCLNAREALAKQPDTRTLDKALIDAELRGVRRAYETDRSDLKQWVLGVAAKLAELNKE